MRRLSRSALPAGRKSVGKVSMCTHMYAAGDANLNPNLRALSCYGQARADAQLKALFRLGKRKAAQCLMPGRMRWIRSAHSHALQQPRSSDTPLVELWRFAPLKAPSVGALFQQFLRDSSSTLWHGVSTNSRRHGSHTSCLDYNDAVVAAAGSSSRLLSSGYDGPVPLSSYYRHATQARSTTEVAPHLDRASVLSASQARLVAFAAHCNRRFPQINAKA